MNRDDRKAAQAAWRERKPQSGVFRLVAGGQTWIGASPTLAAIENRTRFTLAQGSHPNKGFQAAAGQAEVAFEVLEVLDPETPTLSRDRLLKERLAHWLEAGDAQPL